MLETLIKWALIIVGAYLIVRVALRLWRKYHAPAPEAVTTVGVLENGEPDNSPLRDTLGNYHMSGDGGSIAITGYRYGGYSEAGAKTASVYLYDPTVSSYRREFYDAERRQYFLRRM